jgi:hypothetical protein
MNSDINTLQNILNILSGLLTPIIAIIATWIAIMQLKAHRYKIKIDLFERRVRIFESIRNNLISVGNEGSTQKINWTEYNFACRQAIFLLNDKLVKYINQIDFVVHEINTGDIFIYGVGKLPEGEKVEKLVNEHSEHIKWIGDQLEPLEKIFADFMKMNKI